MFDIVVIGAGVSGCAVARELSRYNADVLVIDKCEDVCCGTSKANSAIIHAGFDAAEGSLMARLNVRGSEMMDALCEDLDIPFKRNGALVVCTHKEELSGLTDLYNRGVANGVKGLKILSKEEAFEMEPNLNGNVEGALYAPTSGIICPFHLTIALAENAAENGVKFKFDTEVTDIEKKNGYYVLKTNTGDIETKYVVNAAGVYADVIHNMVSEKKLKITARRGDYCLLDKTAGNFVSKTVFSQPSKMGKGVLVSPTIHGNLIVGPTAIDIDDKESTATTREGLDDLIAKAGETVNNLPIRQVITSFAGLRAHEAGHEFIIEEVEDAKQFIDCAGIESPGLSSSPAIGEMVADILVKLMNLKKKDNFISKRKGILNPAT
ncbi:MAG: NAD(P)/FAD-dependent oxidoreductase, partial [Lachnospiraceae bacterium]|nr:NAD(P)/FAD-dependent oxidoreductase [Lachnospiraceae bacterium]